MGSYDRNSTESPLLRLPAELRVRVWRHTLGGETIHIGVHDNVIKSCICQSPVSDADKASIIKSLDEPTWYDTHPEHHLKCQLAMRVPEKLRTDSAPCLSLGVLASCRQIHHEAALLPFKENIFHLGQEPIEWLGNLIFEQAHAITSVVMTSRCCSWADSVMKTEFEDMLRGLKTIVMFEGTVANWKYAELRGYIDGDGMPTSKEPILMLENMPIEKATVAVYRSDDPDYERQGANKAADNRWADEIERRLTAPSDGLS